MPHHFGQFSLEQPVEYDEDGNPIRVHLRVKESAVVEGKESDEDEDGLADVVMEEQS